MQLESSFDEYEAEISHEIFDDAFEDEFEGDFDEEFDDDFDEELQDDFPTDSRYIDHTDENDFDQQIETLASELDGLSIEEAHDHIAEAFPALIPLITALAPIAIKAVTGIAGKMKKGKTSKPNRTRSNRRPQKQGVRTNPKHQRTKCNCHGGTSITQLGQGALSKLNNLLNNKGVQSILSSLANKDGSQALKLGNSESIAREGALLNAIAFLAKEGQSEIYDDQYPDAMDYLIGPDGDFIADPESSESKAVRFIELFNN